MTPSRLVATTGRCLACLQLTLMVLLFLSGCDTRQTTAVDSWFFPVPEGIDPYSQWEKIDKAQVFEASSPKQPMAQQLLEHQSAMPLTSAQLNDLFGVQTPQASGKSAYLVRALQVHEGPFAVYRSGSKLLIAHSSISGLKNQMQRHALVVLLPEAPTEVYVVCETFR